MDSVDLIISFSLTPVTSDFRCLNLYASAYPLTFFSLSWEVGLVSEVGEVGGLAVAGAPRTAQSTSDPSAISICLLLCLTKHDHDY